MKRCLIYCRCSTADQETRNQLDQLRAYATSQGWQITQAVTDVASGGKGVHGRRGLKQVFDLAHRRQFDILLFWSLDRLSREGSRATIQHLTRLESYGVDWHSHTEEFLSSLGIFKDCIISLLSALAKQEKVRISERTRAGMERSRRVNGTRFGRPKTSPAKIRQAAHLREQGLPYSKIGEKMGITRSRAHQLVSMAAS